MKKLLVLLVYFVFCAWNVTSQETQNENNTEIVMIHEWNMMDGHNGGYYAVVPPDGSIYFIAKNIPQEELKKFRNRENNANLDYKFNPQILQEEINKWINQGFKISQIGNNSNGDFFIILIR